MLEFFISVLLIGGFLWWLIKRKKSSNEQTAVTTIDVRTSSGPLPSQGTRDPKEMVQQSEQCWVPPGHTVEVHWMKLPNGMLYVGKGLQTWGRSGTLEPGLIDPSLPVDRLRPDYTGEKMDYWPSYTNISPASRAAYLEWLAGGRQAGAYIGYVFLFFYGLERRMFVDAQHSPQARAEILAICLEVERLIQLYESNQSFRGYATSFLAAARFAQETPDVSQMTPPQERTGWEIPAQLRVALATFVKDGQPIPGEWAFSWLITHPETRLRTPATRCPEEFRKLFLLRYAGKYGEGIKIKPNKSRLQINYRPASPGLYQGVRLNVGDLPDVTKLSAPLTKLRQLADNVTNELDAYSRWVGRTDDRDSLAALTLLPPDLATTNAEADSLIDWIKEHLGDSDSIVIPAGLLVSQWPSNKLTKREATMVATLLQHYGYGIEPDVRFEGENVSKTEKAVIFRLSDSPIDEPSDSYRAAAALLHLGAAVVTADGQVSAEEERRLEQHLEDALHLPIPERIRLRAHLRWLLEASPRLSGLKQRCEALDDRQRHQIGQFLISVAGADGQLEPAELRALAKIYPLLGLNPDDVYSDIHTLVAGSIRPSTEPVTIVPTDPSAPTYTIPQPHPEKTTKTIALAPDRVAQIMAETQAVADILGAVFEVDEPEPTDEDDQVDAEEAVSDRIAGLDKPHSMLVRHLAERPIWARSQFDELANRLGLMPDGAIEIINEATLDAIDELFLEGDDPLEVNTYAQEELLQ